MESSTWMGVMGATGWRDAARGVCVIGLLDGKVQL